MPRYTYHVRRVLIMLAVKVKKVVEVEVNGLGAMIRKARGDRTITEVSKLAGISRKAWHEIETEKVPVVMLETLVKIQKALDVDFEVKHLDWRDAVTEKINQQENGVKLL